MSEPIRPTAEHPVYREVPSFPTVVVQRRGYPVGRLHDLMDSGFTALGQAIQAGRFTPAGPAFARYDTPMDGAVDLAGDYPLDLEVGFPVETPLAEPIEVGPERIVASNIPEGLIAHAVYTGPYDQLPSAWERFTDKITADGYTMQLPFWEVYHTMPTPDTDPQTLETGLATLVTRA